MLETSESVVHEEQLAISSQRAVSGASANLSNDGTTIILQESSDGNHVTCDEADDEEDEAEEIFSDFAPPSVMNTSQGREKLFLTEEGIIDLNSSELEVFTDQSNRWSDGETSEARFDDGFVMVTRRRGRNSKAERLKLQEVLLELMVNVSDIAETRRFLGYDYAAASNFGKIWFFGSREFSYNVVGNMDQCLHLKIEQVASESCYASWMVGGDFNVIRSLVEYSGVSVQDYDAIDDFYDCVEACELSELATSGDDFTWGGTRSTGWEDLPKCFRFQKMWLRRSEFLEIVAKNWNLPMEAHGMLRFSMKLRRLKSMLKEWNKTAFGNVFENLKNAEDQVRELEINAYRSQLIPGVLGMQKGSFPLIYLGNRLYRGWKRLETFQFLLDALDKRLSSWKNKLLSPGGRILLIRHVLSAIPLHVFAAIEPPKGIIDALDRRCQNFLWQGVDDQAKRHWRSWDALTFPTCENGLGLQKLGDILKYFSLKLWWKIKVNKGLWAKFVGTLSQTARGKTSWQRNAKINSEAVSHAKVLVEGGDHSFWFDEWSDFGIIWDSDVGSPPSPYLSIYDFFAQKDHFLPIIQPFISVEALAFWQNHQLVFQKELWKARNKFLFEDVVISNFAIIRAAMLDIENMLFIHKPPSKYIEERNFLASLFNLKLGRVQKSVKVVSFMAETYGLLFGIRRCVLLGLKRVEIQTDNLALAMMLENGGPYPWKFNLALEEILGILRCWNFTIIYVYRETNAVADSLADLASSGQLEVFRTCRALPSNTRGLLVLDQRSLPYLHIR
ncbi:OLC1v1004827C1 [Oldenlandia corymbosa var. corymbosa]|uniref:OLC1v1004827C1 n=1 Tax=Oldenlandia corymbosa var. corymbosa TaxID=529605 RepID=A0AAV1DDY6_OLDCO|nr:OLC1v1004827C1 [Oldenlandia corymbosa var. corymbosa]